MNGKISYVEPEPIIFSDTIRNNILFGKEYEEERYRRTLNATCLIDDINNMKNGDSELVGDRGVTLSGGQKARIALARAVYADTDVYLMDDPISAVD